MDRRSQFKALKGAHFFDLTIQEGKRKVKVAASNIRLVIQCLFEYLGENDICFPSQLTISVWCGFVSPEQLERYRENGKLPSLNMVKRILRALEENSYITVKRRKIESDAGRKTQNVYSIAWSNIKALNQFQTSLEFEVPEQLEDSAAEPVEESQDWDSLRDRFSESLENAAKVDSQTSNLIEAFGLRQRADISNLQSLVLQHAGEREFQQAVEQAKSFCREKSIPFGHRRLKALNAIYERIQEESYCR